jgi:hypothetical protein
MNNPKRFSMALITVTWGFTAGAAFEITAADQLCETKWYWGNQVGQPGLSGTANDLIVIDDGNGPALYAGGAFSWAGGQIVNRIAKWDGEQWSPLGEGIDGEVRALHVFDDGSRPALYVGGQFTFAGGQFIPQIARWDGEKWSTVGEGVSGGQVRAFKVFDNGTGPALYVGGAFTHAGGQTVNRVATWDGEQWSPLGSGITAGGNLIGVMAFEAFDDGDGPKLYAAGDFTVIGGHQSNNIASRRFGDPADPAGLNCDGVVDGADLLILLGNWGTCADPDDCPADLNGDGVVDGADLLILLSNWG